MSKRARYQCVLTQSTGLRNTVGCIRADQEIPKEQKSLGGETGIRECYLIIWSTAIEHSAAATSVGWGEPSDHV